MGKNSSTTKGRPTAYDPDIHLVLTETMAQLGLTEEEIASKLRLSVRTIARWKVKHPEFLEALKSGKVEPDQLVIRSLYQRAVGYYYSAVKIFKIKDEPATIVRYLEHVPPDVTAQIFWLKNRLPKDWRDRHEVGLTDQEGNPLALAIIQAAQNRKEAKKQNENNSDADPDDSK